MLKIQYATASDIAKWVKFDSYIAEQELLLKIANNRCYILKEGPEPIGVMRYNLFWDSIPFLTFIYLAETVRGKGYGKQALLLWEKEMRVAGFKQLMTSTQADEQAQFLYRKLGYKDVGCLILDLPTLSQATEIFFIKAL